MLKARRVWCRPVHLREWHAVSAVIFGRVVVSYCRQQWREDDECETGEHSLLDRCDDCQRVLIEQDVVVRGLEELTRKAVLMEGWE